jgi:argininosuccinate lyase
VFELIRAHCNRIKALPNEIMLLTTNLPSGYHRDLQLLKEHLFPAFQTMRDCIRMAGLMLSHIEIKKDILEDEKYKYLFTVDAVNQLVKQGIPFRDAYKQVGEQVEQGKFVPPKETMTTTHEGSIGNLCNQEIKKQMEKIVASFPFSSIHKSLQNLLQ